MMKFVFKNALLWREKSLSLPLSCLPEEVAADEDDACEHGEEGDHEGDDAGEDNRVMELHHGLQGSPSSSSPHIAAEVEDTHWWL